MATRRDFQETFRYARPVAGALAAVLVMIYLASGLYSVKPDQRGVVKRFGRIIAADVAPGMHYHLPWPVETVELPQVTGIRSFDLLFDKGQDHAESSELITGDENLVRAAVRVQYAISFPDQFLTATAQPEAMLERLARDATLSLFAEMPVDEALTTGRQRIQDSLRERLQVAADRYRLGVRISSFQLQSLQPPAQVAVAKAFNDLAAAREERRRLVQEARAEADRRLSEARAQSNRLRQESEAYVREVVGRAQGDTERFLAQLAEYRKAPELTAYRLHLETVETIMGRVRKLISQPAETSARRAAPGALLTELE